LICYLDEALQGDDVTGEDVTAATLQQEGSTRSSARGCPKDSSRASSKGSASGSAKGSGGSPRNSARGSPSGSPKAGTPTVAEQERERRRRPEICEEDLNDDDVSVDDRLDVASLGDGSDDELVQSADEDEYARRSPFCRDVIVAGNPPADDVTLGAAAGDDQVGSFIFTNQVCPPFETWHFVTTTAVNATILNSVVLVYK